MKFHKMHGLGNDFVVIHQEGTIPANVSELAKNVCDRHFGIGADGLVFILPSKRADAQMRIFNADGSEAQQCGNAVRCVAKFMYEKLGIHKIDMLIETARGILQIILQVKAGIVEQIQVDMGEPILEPAKIPVRSSSIHHHVEAAGKAFDFTAVSMGNPHAVIEVEKLSDKLVEQAGSQIESNELFPERVNVEFITIHSLREISMRVYERGVGETMACGSGACAVLVASHLNGHAERKATIHLLGGDLTIEWNEEDNHVYMTGAAAFVFAGEYPV